MLLHLNAIPYRYECALSLGGVTLFPDFTIRHPGTGALYYWEHFGLMDDPAYAKTPARSFLSMPQTASFHPVHLITTYETKAYPLNAGMIEHPDFLLFSGFRGLNPCFSLPLPFLFNFARRGSGTVFFLSQTRKSQYFGSGRTFFLFRPGGFFFLFFFPSFRPLLGSGTAFSLSQTRKSQYSGSGRMFSSSRPARKRHYTIPHHFNPQ